jgi:hypothetical protein
MGMFDTVRCDYPLPERPEWAEDFQTKDLENQLDVYHISERGTLRLVRSFGENTPKPQIVDFTGELNFYNTGAPGWVEYDADFVEGRLQDVRLRVYEPR